MKCSCRSKDLYSQQNLMTFTLNSQQLPQSRKLSNQSYPPQIIQIFHSIYEYSQIYQPTTIHKISMQQIHDNPLWFYKNYIALNRPCIIVDGIDDGIIQRWKNPKQFVELTEELGAVSVALTPDGFADSVKGDVFVEPIEKKLKIRQVVNWRQNECETNAIKGHQIPYIQHQNSNLISEMGEFENQIDDKLKNFMSANYFEGNKPDAVNFWMGYEESVSSMHKDPYQNFYSVIVGEKHFSLLAPISIVYLQEDVFRGGLWGLESESEDFVVRIRQNGQNKTVRWISCNPDLQSDEKMFPFLALLRQNKFHVVVEEGETLYLPSLWYHQVAQTHKGAPYTIAVNYWFDMSFGHNYSLYETARKIKGYT